MPVSCHCCRHVLVSCSFEPQARSLAFTVVDVYCLAFTAADMYCFAVTVVDMNCLSVPIVDMC
jgi:hypothetical protein